MVLDVLKDFLGERELLLVLDNREHVLEPVTRLTDELLRWCPGGGHEQGSARHRGGGHDAGAALPVPGPEAGEALRVLSRFDVVN